MLDAETKARIDSARDILVGAILPSPSGGRGRGEGEYFALRD